VVAIHDGAIILHVAKLNRFTVNNLLLNSTAVEGVHFLFPFYALPKNPRVEIIYRGFVLNRLPENYASIF